MQIPLNAVENIKIIKVKRVVTFSGRKIFMKRIKSERQEEMYQLEISQRRKVSVSFRQEEKKKAKVSTS